MLALATKAMQEAARTSLRAMTIHISSTGSRSTIDTFTEAGIIANMQKRVAISQIRFHALALCFHVSFSQNRCTHLRDMHEEFEN